MSTHGLLFQWANTIKIQLNVFGIMQSERHHHFIECNLFLPWYSWTIAHFDVTQRSHTQSMGERTNNILQSITQGTRDWPNMNPRRKMEWTHELWKLKEFILHLYHQSRNCCQKSDEIMKEGVMTGCFIIIIDTFKPVLRGHLWDKENEAL